MRRSVAAFALPALIVSACGSHRLAGNVHEDCYFDDCAAGEWIVGTRPLVENHTPYPVSQG